MRWDWLIIFFVGACVGTAATYFGVASVRQESLARERLHVYQRFMSYYAGRDRCLALTPAAHADNETLLASLALLGPANVSKDAERHYLACTQVRADAYSSNVPADWARRPNHSWTRFDRSRSLLMGQMAASLPKRYRLTLATSRQSTDPGASAATRNR